MNEVKQNLRDEVRRSLRAISKSDIAQRSQTICRNIASLDEFKRARVIMTFMPCALEVDVLPLMREAFSAGKRVCLPVVVENGIMKAVEHSKNGELITGEYGILRPAGESVMTPDDIDLIITPGLAFDRNGARLGKGGGYYDRFLNIVKAVVIAPAFLEQLLALVPTDENDVSVDIVVTERETVYCDRQAKGLIK